jgi:hypothetical protein
MVVVSPYRSSRKKLARSLGALHWIKAALEDTKGAASISTVNNAPKAVAIRPSAVFGGDSCRS